MKPDEIALLKSFDKTQWFEFFEKVLYYKSLPYPVIYATETADKFLTYINDALLEYKEIDYSKTYQIFLLEYCLNLNPGSHTNESIYNIFFALSSIRPKVSLTERLEILLTSEVLKEHYWDSISLHSTLLGLINDLEIINSDRIRHYLNQCDFTKYDLSFCRVSLRFFIKKGLIKEYFEKFKRMLIEDSREKLPELLGRSLLELRDYVGSFHDIYSWIAIDWSSFPKEDQKRSILIYINQFLHYENNAFINDTYGKLLKCHIIKDRYILPPKLICDILKETEGFDHKFRKLILSLIKKYFRDNINSVKESDENILISDFYGEYYYQVFPMDNVDILFYEANFRLNRNVLFIQKVTRDTFNIIYSFKEVQHDSWYSTMKEVLDIEEKDVPVYADLESCHNTD